MESNPPKRRNGLKIALLALAGIVIIAFLGIQLIPVNRINPAVTTPIKWDSPQTQALAQRACMDCHSNETVWPWYSYVAPASWLVYYDVLRGRSEMNFSTLSSQSAGFQPGSASTNDIAYQLGQFLAGGSANREGGPEGGAFPGSGAFPGGGDRQRPQGTPPTGGQAGGFRPGGGSGNRFAEVFNNNSMPPANYTLMHPSANLSAEERQQLLQGLTATFRATGQ
jgi:hypothetical protein